MAEPVYPTLHVDVEAAQLELVQDRLWELGATGLEERDGTTMDRGAADAITLVAHFDSEAEARRAGDALVDAEGVRGEARLVPIVGDAWRDGWKAFFHVQRFGRLVLRPSWEDFAPAPDDVVLTFDPGQAFGTGTHETTRLILRHLARTDMQGRTVLDVGTGSGVLAIGARLLGAASAWGVDIDPIAVHTAAENAARNGVEARFDETPIDDLDGTYDEVFANIRAPVLVPHAASIAARVAPGGTLVLSGILAGEEDEVRAAYAALGPWAEDATEVDGDWVALRWRRP